MSDPILETNLHSYLSSTRFIKTSSSWLLPAKLYLECSTYETCRSLAFSVFLISFLLFTAENASYSSSTNSFLSPTFYSSLTHSWQIKMQRIMLSKASDGSSFVNSHLIKFGIWRPLSKLALFLSCSVRLFLTYFVTFISLNSRLFSVIVPVLSQKR
jgi:hypothetical protein